jgi:hypothetical protein
MHNTCPRSSDSLHSSSEWGAIGNREIGTHDQKGKEGSLESFQAIQLCRWLLKIFYALHPASSLSEGVVRLQKRRGSQLSLYGCGRINSIIDLSGDSIAHEASYY